MTLSVCVLSQRSERESKKREELQSQNRAARLVRSWKATGHSRSLLCKSTCKHTYTHHLAQTLRESFIRNPLRIHPIMRQECIWSFRSSAWALTEPEPLEMTWRCGLVLLHHGPHVSCVCVPRCVSAYDGCKEPLFLSHRSGRSGLTSIPEITFFFMLMFDLKVWTRAFAGLHESTGVPIKSMSN